MKSAGPPPLMLMLALALAPLPALAPAGRQRQQRWKPLPPPECGSELHDPQTKWLLSDLVVRASWRASDESTPSRSGEYNVTLTVASQLKLWSRDLTGQRITIGVFNRTQSRHQKALQRLTCVPCDLQRGRRGHVFFLRQTADPAYFRHAFLPMRFKRRLETKFARVQCNQMRACPTPPELVQEARKRVKTDQQRRRVTLRLLCKARGLPQPRPLWLKDGRRLEPGGAVAQFKNRNRAIISRLVLKEATRADAGTYTCVFRNIKGQVNSSIVVSAEDLVLAVGLRTSTTSTNAPPMAYLCDYKNFTYCLHGGTCVISRSTNEPSCRCPPEFTGFFCEKLDIEHMYQEQIRKGLALNLASAGASGLPTAVSVTGAVLILAVVAVFVVLLVICCLVVKIRRRLDQDYWKTVSGRNGPSNPGIEEIQLTTSIGAPGVSRALSDVSAADAATMTDDNEQSWRRHPLHQPAPAPPNQYQYYYSPLLQQSHLPNQAPPLLSNGPAKLQTPTSRVASAATGRSRHSSGTGGPPAYTYQSPGHAALPPVHIRPVFDYRETVTVAASATATPTAARVPAAGGAVERSDDANEPIDLMKELNRIKWLQEQQLQLQSAEAAEAADVADTADAVETPTEQEALLPRGRQAPAPAKSTVSKHGGAPAGGRPLPFPGHGPPPERQQQQQPSQFPFPKK